MGIGKYRAMRLSALGAAFLFSACASAPQPPIGVFFSPDSAAMSPAADAVVKAAAQRIADQHPDSVIVEGHADGASLAASLTAADRATVVEKALEEDGVDAARIQVQTGAPNDTGAVGRNVEIMLK
jgi:hypothetical protein